MKKNKLLFPILLLASAIAAGGCSKDKDKDIEEIINVEVPETPEPPDEPEAPESPFPPNTPA